MTNTEIKATLSKVINTLNVVEVKGRENLNHLLGVILTLEDIVNNVKTEEAPEDEEH